MRTNMSFAIVCMTTENRTTEVEEGTLNKCGKEIVTQGALDDVVGEFDWDKSTQGYILGAFFWGYLGSQVLGGYLASRFGGKRVILTTILGSSLLTLASPVAARTHAYILAAVRVAIGFLQGATFPAMHTMWSVWGPPLELSVLTGVTYAVCSSIQLCSDWKCACASFFWIPLSVWVRWWLAQHFLLTWCSWNSMVYFLMYMVSDRPSNHPRISEAEKQYITTAVEASVGKHTGKHPPTPWRSIITSRAVWACWFGHFAGDWGAYTMLVSLPSYLKDVLGLELSSLGMLSAIPYVAYFIVINVGGVAADFIRSKKILGTLNTRRAAMLLASAWSSNIPCAVRLLWLWAGALVIVFLTVGMAISGLQYSGFVVNYLDIAPSFSGTIMGMGNTISSLAGIASPMVTSALTPNGSQEEWQSVLWCTAAILTTGALIFTLFASGEVQDWAKHKGGDKSDELPLKSVAFEKNNR
ncbi:hypothetical protein KIN20_008290 [Parelaphostrongylus tenuis]|uniref:Major facilitator superfamily (MFS) profile domain-containing protein n=1 Tax=Parelaphostrongylus tenuis TaxID=148309 RepID=A0AAD5M4K7_PARTN|nr:hypothetical protein KIN20_008290 [Parelaphostrongylus tenuis]